MVQLRAFRWNDLDGVLDVRNASGEVDSGEGTTTRERLRAYWRLDEARVASDLWVVEERGEILACGGLRPWYGPDWLQAEVVVRPARRRQGLGHALLAQLVAESRERGVRYLGATAPDEPAEAGEFLRRHGFEPFVPRQHMRLRPIVVPEARGLAAHRLRLARVEESAALAEVTNAAYGAGERSGRADAAGYRRYLEESGARVWVAEYVPRWQVVGLCEVHGREVAIDGATVTSGHIASLAVEPASRGQGLGRWLLAAGIGLCLQARWPSVELNVDRDNAPALHLYESVGFRPVYAYTAYRLALA